MIQRIHRSIGRATAATVAALVAIVVASRDAAAQTIAITGGKVFPVSGPALDNATVLIRDGKIVAVGTSVAIPAGAQRIDATGKWVTPGLIDAETQLGLFDVEGGAGPTDVAAKGHDDGLTPSFAAWLGANPRSVYVAPARQSGVTSVITAPAPGGIVNGQAALIDLVDGSVADMLVKAPAGMMANMDFPPTNRVGARGELFVLLRELLDDTKTFARHRAEYERNQTRTFVVGRTELEAMIPVVEGREPLMLQASRASDIEAALTLAKDYSLRLILVGGAEAWMVADKIAAAKVPVLVGAMNNIPSTFNTLSSRQENAAQLRAAGVTVAIIGNAGDGDEDQFNIRNIRQEAGNAVAYGLPWAEALRAVTLAPAAMFGAGDRLGTLEAGRVANVVIWSGDPFELSTQAEHVYVHGHEYTAPTRQDLLEQRYKTLPPSYKRP